MRIDRSVEGVQRYTNISTTKLSCRICLLVKVLRIKRCNRVDIVDAPRRARERDKEVKESKSVLIGRDVVLCKNCDGADKILRPLVTVFATFDRQYEASAV